MTSRSQMSHESILETRRKFMQALIAFGMSASAAAHASDQIPLAPPDKQPPKLKVPEAVGRQIRWAIVGLGELALGEIMPAFAECKWSKPTALVSGHRDKALQVAAVYDISEKNIYNYDNFDSLAENEDVDVIYIVLPNSMHAEYTIRGLKAGKHVLCEKPMAANVEECERMIQAAESAKKQLMIAYRLHFEPLNQRVMELCKTEKFGAIKSFSSSNCQNVEAPNIRLSKELAGGPVSDIGVYSINAARYCINAEPIEVSAYAHQPSDDPRFREVPESVAFTLKYPDGELASCDCSFGAAVSRKYRVHCEKGYIDMDPAFSYTGLELHVHDGESKQQVMIDQVNHFAAEMDHFSKCLLDDCACDTPGSMGLADQRIIDAIARSIESGKPVKIGSN